MEIFENDGGSHYGQGIGMLLGLAVGDALGAYLEFGDAREELENYLRGYQAGGPLESSDGRHVLTYKF